MTQHTMNDLVFDDSLFSETDCVHEEYDDFRGLTCCQAGRALQAAWRKRLPEIRELVEFLDALKPEQLPPNVARNTRLLKDWYRLEFGAL